MHLRRVPQLVLSWKQRFYDTAIESLPFAPVSLLWLQLLLERHRRGEHKWEAGPGRQDHRFQEGTDLAMPDFPFLSSLPPAVSPTPTTLPGFPSDDPHVRAHTILIVIIFCVVCFLLLVAFFYTFCFRCTMDPLPKDARSAPSSSMDREDATFHRSSSCPSAGNSI
ncbi:hypothetical protein GN956_G15430 [Arapaima gigas]